MKDILLECINCKQCFIVDKNRDGYSCPECGGPIIPRGYIEELKKSIKEAEKKIKSAIWNGNIREAAKREKLKSNHMVYGVDFGKGKDLTVEIKINTEPICKDIERLINTLEVFMKQGITTVPEKPKAPPLKFK